MLDRLQRATEQYGGGDHDAGRRIGGDHQPCADPERQQLHRLPRRACQRGQTRGARAQRRLRVEKRVVPRTPDTDRRRVHAHADDRFRVASQCIGVPVDRTPATRDVGCRLSGQAFGDRRQSQQQRAADRGRRAERRMHQADHQQ